MKKGKNARCDQHVGNWETGFYIYGEGGTFKKFAPSGG